MASRQFHLTEREVEAFRKAERTSRDIHERTRLQAVRLYGTGMATQLIMEIVGCGESSIRQWAQHYKASGMDAMRSHWRGGNANKLTKEQRADLRQRLHQYRPRDLTISMGEFWTISDLSVAVERWYGVVYQSPDSYADLLHACGFSYQRAERVYRSRPKAVDIAAFEAELEKK
jgi:transposase